MSLNDHPWLGIQLFPEQRAAYTGTALATMLGRGTTPILPLVPGHTEPTNGPLGRISTILTQFSVVSSNPPLDLDSVEKLALDDIRQKSTRTAGPASVLEFAKASNLIALRTRRGPGQIVLCHPRTLEQYLSRNTPAHHLAIGPFGHQASWTLAARKETPSGNYLPEFWTKPTVAEGEFIVIYKGTAPYDAGYFAIGHEDSLCFYANDLGMYSAHDYAYIVPLN